MRKKLIDKIVELSTDEITKQDLYNMSTETEEELINRLISIAEFYAYKYHN